MDSRSTFAISSTPPLSFEWRRCEKISKILFFILALFFSSLYLTSIFSYSRSVILFEPGSIVSRGGVVIVTINYRLGLPGWFEDTSSWSHSTIPGNQAFRDQILALQWFQKNFAPFGGDPKQVTVFGESAGANSIRILLSAPSTFGLYQNVIGESDPVNIPYHTTQSAAKLTNYFMVSLGCNPGNIECARGKSTNEILEESMKADQLDWIMILGRPLDLLNGLPQMKTSSQLTSQHSSSREDSTPRPKSCGARQGTKPDSTSLSTF